MDYKAQIAKIPERSVRKALKTVPKETTLHGRDPKHNLRIPVNSWLYVGTSGLGTFIGDIKTGKKRVSTVRDIADLVKLADALTGADYVQTSLTTTEVHPLTHGLHELWTALHNATIHVQGVEIFNAEDAKKQIELGAFIAGGEALARS